MIRLRCTIRGCLLAVAAVCGSAGCAGMRMPEPPIADISDRHQQRRQEAVEHFERQRNESEYRLAVSRWRQGDISSCRSTLNQLLQRDAKHLPARRLLAAVCLEEEDIQEHELQLRLLLRDHPDDAAAHHAMGLALETSGRAKEAEKHFRRALWLTPENKLYALSCSERIDPQASPTTPVSTPVVDPAVEATTFGLVR